VTIGSGSSVLATNIKRSAGLLQRHTNFQKNVYLLQNYAVRVILKLQKVNYFLQNIIRK